MATIDIKAELKMLIDKEANLSILQALKTLLVRERTDWWDELSANEKEEIEQGLSQAERGEFISHDDVMRKYRQQLKIEDIVLSAAIKEGKTGDYVNTASFIEQLRK